MIDNPAQSQAGEVTAQASGAGRFIGKLPVPPWAALLVLSCLVTIAFWSVLPERFKVNEQSDYIGAYEPIARSFMSGHALPADQMGLMTTYPPGYSLILAGLFTGSRWLGLSEQFSLSALAVACMALSCVFVFLLARMFWSTRGAVISAAVWMTYPLALWLTKQPNSELPFMVLLLGTLTLFWFALQRSSLTFWLLVGLLAGATMLIRPIALGIGFVLCAILWFARRDLGKRARIVMMSLILFGNLVAVLPWEAWVYSRTGQVILLSTNGLKSMRDGLTFAVDSKGYRENLSLPNDVRDVMSDLTPRGGVTTLGQLARVVVGELRSHPAGTIKLMMLKLLRSWYGTDSSRFEWVIILIQLPYLFLFALSSWRGLRGNRHQRVLIFGTLFIIGYFWMMTAVALSIVRYMVPAIGLLCVVVGGGYSAGRQPKPEPAHN